MKNTPTSKHLLTALAALTLATVTANAETLDLNPLVDTYIRGSQPTNNFSGASEYLLGFTASAEELKALFKFDLNQPELIGSTINSVSLTLYKDRTDSTSSTSSTIQIFQTLENWDSTDVTWNEYSNGNTWNTAGAEGAGSDFDNTLLASFTATPNDDTAVPVGSAMAFISTSDFTDLISNNIGSAIGLVAAMEDTANRAIWDIASNEVANGNIQRIPTLTIDYTPVPEPSSYALLAGALTLGCVLSRRKRS